MVHCLIELLQCIDTPKVLEVPGLTARASSSSKDRH